MSTFKGSYNHHVVNVKVHSDESVTYTTEALKKKHPKYSWDDFEEFDTYAKVCRALDAYDLKCRKNFTNKTAYMVERPWNGGTGETEEVTVTSIDANGNEAWVIRKEGRRKVRIESLYADKDICDAYVKALRATIDCFEKEKETLFKKLEEFRWVPNIFDGVEKEHVAI